MADRAHVLVVEHDRSARAILERILTRRGYGFTAEKPRKSTISEPRSLVAEMSQFRRKLGSAEPFSHRPPRSPGGMRIAPAL